MMVSWVSSEATKNSTNDHRRRSRIALQHPRPYCRPAHRNFASKVRCRRLYEHHINFKRLANGAVKIISAKRILAFDWSMGCPEMVAFMMLVPGSGQRWKTAFKTPMIASGGTANELHG